MIATSEVRTELRKRILAEARKRDPKAFATALRAEVLASLTRKQLAVVDQMSAGTRYISLCCSRRAGKTHLLSRLILVALLDAKHNEAIFYLAPTLQRGKRLIWKDLEKLVIHYGLDRESGGPWRLIENTGEITTDAGAAFIILGLNKQKQATLGTRGFKTNLVCLDESQELDHLLIPLLTSVSPSLADNRGSFLVAGTPGAVKQGPWFEVSHGKRGGFMPFHWTIRDNEKWLHDPEETLREEREREGWTLDNPDYLREWEGVWAEDTTQLLCDYRADRNAISVLPANYDLSWRHVIGMDFGWDDASTWVVVAANPYGPERIVVHAETHAEMDNDAAATVTAGLVERFSTTYVVCDPAGGGKGFYATFNARYGAELGCQIRPANKLGKVDSVKVINTDLRTGRLQLYLPDAEPLAKELRVLRWKKRETGEVWTSKTVRDDVFDAARYSLVEIAPWVPRDAPVDTPEKAAERAYQDKLRRDAGARRREQANRDARTRGQHWSGNR